MKTLEQIIAEAKDAKLDPKAIAAGLGLDLAALEAEAARAKTLEAELAAAKAGPPEPDPEALDAAKAAGQSELVAALGEGLRGAGIINLAEGQQPTLAEVVKAIADTAAAGKQARIALSESTFNSTFDRAVREGRVVPAQKDTLKGIWLNEALGGPQVVTTLIEATPAKSKVDFSEHGTAGDLEDPDTGEQIDVSAEVERYAKLVNSYKGA